MEFASLIKRAIPSVSNSAVVIAGQGDGARVLLSAVPSLSRTKEDLSSECRENDAFHAATRSGLAGKNGLL